MLIYWRVYHAQTRDILMIGGKIHPIFFLQVVGSLPKTALGCFPLHQRYDGTFEQVLQLGNWALSQQSPLTNAKNDEIITQGKDMQIMNQYNLDISMASSPLNNKQSRVHTYPSLDPLLTLSTPPQSKALGRLLSVLR